MIKTEITEKGFIVTMDNDTQYYTVLHVAHSVRADILTNRVCDSPKVFQKLMDLGLICIRENNFPYIINLKYDETAEYQDVLDGKMTYAELTDLYKNKSIEFVKFYLDGFDTITENYKDCKDDEYNELLLDIYESLWLYFVDINSGYVPITLYDNNIEIIEERFFNTKLVHKGGLLNE